MFAAVSWLFLGGVVVQVFLAGLGAFTLTDWTAHAGFGWLLASVPLFVQLPLGLVTSSDRRARWLVVILAMSAAFQPELARARAENPVLAAFHPVNALLIAWLAVQVARASLRGLRQAESSGTAPEAAASSEAASPGTPT